MPDLSSNATTLRDEDYRIRLYAAIFAGTVVYTADIDAVDAVNTVSELTISGGSGTFSDVKRGSEVVIYNSSGDYKGNVRIRRAGTLSTANIPIAETAHGFVDIVAGDTLAVLDDHRIRPVFPEATSTFDPDKETWTNQTEAYDPIAHSGGHFAAWVDTGQSYATVNFYGSSSYALDPDSGGSLTHSWTFPSGATPTSSTSADPSGVQIPVGEWRIEHTVTDSSNSQTRTQYVYCGVYNTANPPHEVDSDSLSLSGTELDGWELSFRLTASNDLTSIPDGAWVVLFSQEYYAGTQQSFGNINSGRSSIKFVGILRSDSASTDVDSSQLQLTAISPIQVLRETAGFSQYFASKTTAATWQELEEMGTKNVILHLLRTYTTVDSMCDIYFNAADYAYPLLDFQKDTPFGQVMEIADGIEARLTCDRTCNLDFQKYPEFYELGDRASLTTTYTFDEYEDVFSIQVDREQRETLRLLEAKSFISSGISLGGIFSRFPSLTPGEASQDTVIDWILADNQDDLNTKAGLHGGKLNRVFIDANGYKQFAPRLRLTCKLDVFDFYQEWIALSLDETSNWRGVDLSSFRWVIRQIDVDYSGGSANVTLTLDAETAAPAGETYIPPEEDETQFPDAEIPPISIPPGDPGPFPIIDFNDNDGNVAVIGNKTANGLVIQVTSNFDEDTPSWTTYDHSATVAEDVIVFLLDASTTDTANVAGWAFTKSYIYYLDDIFVASPTITLQHTFTTASLLKTAVADYIYNPGTHLCCGYNILNTKTVAVYTTDGSTWTETDIHAGGTLTGSIPRMFYSTASAGTIFAFVPTDFDSNGTVNDAVLWRSTNSGVGWSAVDPTYTDFIAQRENNGVVCHFPYRGGSNYVYYSAEDTGGGFSKNRLTISNIATTATATLTVQDAQGEWSIESGEHQVQSAYTKNKLFISMSQPDNSLGQIWVSTNFNTTAPSLAPLSGATVGSSEFTGFVCAPDGSELVLWGSNTVWLWRETNPGLQEKASFLTYSIKFVYVK